ncbi:MAG: fumarylacetoacetate hydrolase family protein [Pyrinomonadaceae bacterium]|nr:fumarylacetoacetate hydrolase family protein [Pyrinomonadaceae bacterium]
MKIVTFTDKNDDEKYGIGALVSEKEIVDLTPLISNEGLSASRISACFDLDKSVFADNNLGGRSLPRLNRNEIKLCAPVPRPGKIVCIGLNYRDHAEESGMEIPKSPVVFSKFSSCAVGLNDAIVLPEGSEQVDFEAELAFVIGRRAKNISRDDAMDYVFGYTNFNDVSARDFQFADGQWQRGKSCDTFAPMGEFVATKDEIADPHNLQIQFRLNGETLQNSNTKQLIFKIPELIEFLSSSITLEPGDVIATGTPPGVGFARKPPLFMKDGDIAEVEIEGLGILSNRVKSQNQLRQRMV